MAKEAFELEAATIFDQTRLITVHTPNGAGPSQKMTIGSLISGFTRPDIPRANQGINYYHESMGYITRTVGEIDADLDDMIAHGTKSIRLLHNPMKETQNWDSSSQIYLIIQRAKIKGLFVLVSANFESASQINYDAGTATGGSATTLVDTFKNWTVNQWVGFQVYLTAGTGSGQVGSIVSNTANTLTVVAEDGFATFSPSPASGTTYRISFEKIAEGPWNVDNGYADRVIQFATQSRLAGADAFEVGNELSSHRRGADTFTNDTNLPGNIRALADSVAAQSGFTISQVGYANEFHKVGSWANNGGVGSMGHLGFNFYANNASFYGDTQDAINNFGADKVWATEWSAETTFGALAVSELEYTRILRERQGHLRSLGIRSFAFCYRETSDDGFGYKKSVGTGGERDAWNDSYAQNSISDASDVLLYAATDGQVIAWDETTKRWGPADPAAGGAGVTDHGDLTGLTVDDHPQYLLTDGTRTLAGNLTVVNAGVVTKGYRFRTNGGSLDIEGTGADIWFSIFDSADFTGTQRVFFVAKANGDGIQFRSKAIFNDDSGDIDTIIRGDTDGNLLYADASADKIGIGTDSPAGSKLDINDDSVRVRTAKTPATAGATGVQGQIAWDANFVYVCVATNTWKKAAIATW